VTVSHAAAAPRWPSAVCKMAELSPTDQPLLAELKHVWRPFKCIKHELKVIFGAKRIPFVL
jgi:hypothetical protein